MAVSDKDRVVQQANAGTCGTGTIADGGDGADGCYEAGHAVLTGRGDSHMDGFG